MALNIKQISIPIVILIISLSVIFVGYSAFSNNPAVNISNAYFNESNEPHEPEEESVSKDASTVSTKIYGYDLKPNTKPQFNVGQRFKYEATTSLGKPKYYEYFIKNTERISNKDYFLIALTETSEGYSEEMMMYVDKENGEILKMTVQAGEMEVTFKDGLLSAMLMDKTFFFDSWMLALKENINWVQKINITDEFGSAEGEINYKVTGIEKVTGRNLFTVEIAYLDKNHDTGLNEILYTKTHRIDVDKRIIVKSQIVSENLVVEEMNLISES